MSALFVFYLLVIFTAANFPSVRAKARRKLFSSVELPTKLLKCILYDTSHRKAFSPRGIKLSAVIYSVLSFCAGIKIYPIKEASRLL